MYIGVDIGGTKTLVASLNDDGVIAEKFRFETPKNYDFFLHELRFAVHKLTEKDFRAGGVGVPGVLDRIHGRAISLGNLPWKNVPIHDDIERIVKCPVVMENDAKLAALSEAMMVKDTYNKVMYITVSTGIGYALVVDQKIDTYVGDAGGKGMLVARHGKLVPWESFASGHAIVERYGKKAHDIHDKKTWQSIVRDLKPGILELMAVMEPEVIIFGGSVGLYFERFGKLLRDELIKHETPLVPVPKLRGAARPEEAVLFGCYDLAKSVYGKVSHAHTR